MMLKHFVTLAVLAAGIQVHAAGEGPFPVGNIGTLDNTYVYLYGSHPGDLSGFTDVFSFQSSGAGYVAGLIIPLPDANIPLTDLAWIGGLAITDSNNQFLAVSTDASTNFQVLALMPAAGTYDLLVFGAGSPGAGFYYGAVATQLFPVPEPATDLLFLSGLGGLVGWVARRSGRQAVAAPVGDVSIAGCSAPGPVA
jgi:hypothetical protein